MKQVELIKNMTDQEVKQQLYLSQIIFFLLSIGLSFVFFDHFTDWFTYFYFDLKQLLMYSILPAVGFIIVNVLIIRVVPQHLYDDGGINEKIFRNQPVHSIFLINLVVAISEEFLFRGLLQTSFGYVIASSIFVLVHLRYLTKPFLLASIILISFFIGYLFLLTQNLTVVIVFHFIYNFILGLIIKFKK